MVVVDSPVDFIVPKCKIPVLQRLFPFSPKTQRDYLVPDHVLIAPTCIAMLFLLNLPSTNSAMPACPTRTRTTRSLPWRSAAASGAPWCSERPLWPKSGETLTTAKRLFVQRFERQMRWLLWLWMACWTSLYPNAHESQIPVLPVSPEG